MKFTNTDCVGEEICWHFRRQSYGQLCAQVGYWLLRQVDRGVTRKAYDHHILIETKILEEIDE